MSRRIAPLLTSQVMLKKAWTTKIVALVVSVLAISSMVTKCIFPKKKD